jgi:pyruvate formate lyase activating enzyme
MAETGTIFAIKRYAIHDGPNLRTTVFFKGCPLSCIWCHNPEGLNPAIGVVTSNDKCIGCGACVEACPTKALTLSSEGIARETSRCTLDMECVRVCPTLAHEATGRETDVPTLMSELKKDIPFYEQSGGGVTFSGGEPLQQADFLLEILKACGKENIHRAVDTCGYAPTETLLQIAEHTDLFLFDLKHMDSDEHQRVTGEPNEQILQNITALAQTEAAIRVRFPLIPGINTDEKNVRATGAFIATLPGVNDIDLLPYHGAAKSKYDRLGMKNPDSDRVILDPDDRNRVVTILKEYGLTARFGG